MSLTLKDWEERMGPTNLKHIAEIMAQSNDFLDEMIKDLPPEPPLSWHKKLCAALGNKLIEIGLKLGGYYPYD